MRKFFAALGAAIVVAGFAAPSAGEVVVNHEEQYSIWPSHKDVPSGWRQTGTPQVSGELVCDPSEPAQNLQIVWGEDETNKFHLNELTDGECTPTNPDEPRDGGTYEGSGTGRCNGEDGVEIEFKFFDSGDRPHQGNDTADFTIGGDVVERVANGQAPSICSFHWDGTEQEGGPQIMVHKRRSRS